MNDKYILNDQGEPQPEPDLLKWASWFETAPRQVARTEINGLVISTIFLGLDHSFGEGPPMLWETMVFGGKLDQDQDRCGGNRREALNMHELMVQKVENA